MQVSNILHETNSHEMRTMGAVIELNLYSLRIGQWESPHLGTYYTRERVVENVHILMYLKNLKANSHEDNSKKHAFCCGGRSEPTRVLCEISAVFLYCLSWTI